MPDIFKAMADPMRREILLMHGKEPNSALVFNMTRSAVPKHIRILQASSLVGVEMHAKDGRQRNCYTQLEVSQYLETLEKHWKKKFSGLKNYFTKKHLK